MRISEPSIHWFARDAGSAYWAVMDCGDLRLLLEAQHFDGGFAACLAFFSPCCGSLFSHRKLMGLCNSCNQDWTVGGGEWPDQGKEGEWRDGERLSRTVLFDSGGKPEPDASHVINTWLERLGANPLEAEVGTCMLLTLPFRDFETPADLPLIQTSNMGYKLEGFYKYDILKKTGAYSG